MFTRLLRLPRTPKQTFFLWGPRQTGKTTLLKRSYPDAFRVDLLKSEELLGVLQRPSSFREQVQALPKKQLVIVDEIQKAPLLLDEVHYLIQEQGRVFGLCGSSARKVKRGHANLLGGRAIRYELFGLLAGEIGKDFDLTRMLNSGPLPAHYGHSRLDMILRSYVDDYLREEVLQEGLIRNLPVFSDFLRVAAIGDTEVINFSNVARESGVKLPMVREYFQILVDTLLGTFLPAYTARAKRRTVQAPKYYFRDVGVVNQLARRGAIRPGSELFGKAFENWLCHELMAHSHYSEKYYELAYWRLTTGTEVDFVLGAAEVAVEAKAKGQVPTHDLRNLREFKRDHPRTRHLLVASLESRARRTDDGIWIFPYQEFLEKLWQGEWI